MDNMEPVKVINSAMSPSPWGNIKPSMESSLADIMSEELAKDLQLKEESYLEGNKSDLDLLALGDDIMGESTIDCDSDEAIARALQLQFDKEHDEILKRTENKFNGDSKVSISYTKYRRAPYSDDFESESEAEDEVDDRHRVWDSFEASEKSFAPIPRCGYRRLGTNELAPSDEVPKPETSLGRSPGKSTMVTKHDVVTADRKNACRVMTAFPPEVCTGDGGGFDMRLSNKVFNSLRAHHQAESKRRLRVADKSERATCEQCLDPPTRLLLLKLLDGGTLETVNGILSTGKEAVVLHAVGGSGVPAKDQQSSGWNAKDIVIPEECAIKIFKTTLNRFKSREKYIREDYRFKDRFSKQNPRKVIHLWAEKEMHNLIRMQKAGIPCPDVVCLKKHILVLSFVGDGERHRAAPKLKDAILKPEQYVKAYNQIVEAMVKMYRDAELVHCDLSEYNVLWQSKEERCIIIDVAQAVEATSHPHALPFLLRDCENVTSFFRRKGVKEAKSAQELFTQVSGRSVNDESGRTLEEQIQEYEKNEERLTHGLPDKSYSFDYCWEQSKKMLAVEDHEDVEEQ
ncbi:serine/threonine-protein kinase RIO3 [Ischnura elegans]|uniref:serine/threonine-protein kinase RIO3 n=1 Tax=Ischnura elegans TaxID=197161 RepID=UPI001ED8B2D9|nr:serine/threonine-protein kinase RIO3 [Ischnura elegans]